MHIIALSDLHGNLPAIPSTDLILLAGDICGHGNSKQQAHWLDTKFRRWLSTLPAPVIGVAGNHDWAFYDRVAPELPWTYLEDSGTTFKGYNIWGSPWQLEFYNWAFNLPGPELPFKWNLIPQNTDILICHSPPYGFGDIARGKHVGCPHLYNKIVEIKPRLTVFGHIHSGHSLHRVGNMIIANVSILNEEYRLAYPLTEVHI